MRHRTVDGHHDGGELCEVLDQRVDALQDAAHDAGQQRQQAALPVLRVLPRLLQRGGVATVKVWSLEIN